MAEHGVFDGIAYTRYYFRRQDGQLPAWNRTVYRLYGLTL